jgi:integrase
MGSRRGHGEGSIYQRKDGRWVGEIDLGRKADGKRNRKPLYGKTRPEVAKKLRELQKAKDAGLPIPDERLTVGTFHDHWLADVAPRTAGEGSIEAYERRIRLYLRPALGHIRLHKLEPGDVEKMMTDMEARGLSPATIDGARKVLVRALRCAMHEGRTARIVAALVGGAGKSRTKGKTKKRRGFTIEQAKVFVAALKKERLEAAYFLTLAIGTRKGETLGASWNTTDLDAGTLEVSQQLQRCKERGWCSCHQRLVASARFHCRPLSLRCFVNGVNNKPSIDLPQAQSGQTKMILCSRRRRKRRLTPTTSATGLPRSPRTPVLVSGLSTSCGTLLAHCCLRWELRSNTSPRYLGTRRIGSLVTLIFTPPIRARPRR